MRLNLNRVVFRVEIGSQQNTKIVSKANANYQ